MTTTAAPRVKICGLRSVEAALAAREAGADLLGFNFAPVSKRRVDPAVAREAIYECRGAGALSPLTPLRLGVRGTFPPLPVGEGGGEGAAGFPLPSPLPQGEGTPARGPAMVGIFVNQPVEEVAALARECGLDGIQLSGDEDVGYCRALGASAGLPIIKSVRPGRPGQIERAEEYAGQGGVGVLLADATLAGSWGGSGEAWDWQAAAGLAERYLLLLAGGLTPDNVAVAVAAVRPWGVDVASGVETGGRTDPEKVRAFVRNAKGA